MATLTYTFTAGNEVGAQLRHLASVLEQVANSMPDRLSTGASTTVVFDNAPSTGWASVQVTGGPYSGSLFLV